MQVSRMVWRVPSNVTYGERSEVRHTPMPGREGRVAEERSGLHKDEAWGRSGHCCPIKLVAGRTTREPKKTFLMAQGSSPPPRAKLFRKAGRGALCYRWWERGRGSRGEQAP